MDRMTLALMALGILLLVAHPRAQERGDRERTGLGWVERVDKTMEVKPGGTLTVVTDRGGIHATEGAQGAVHVVVEKHADVFTEGEASRIFDDYIVTITQEGNDVRVRAESKGGRELRSLDVDVVVSVPAQYSVDLQTEGGGIEVGDLQGNVRARTGGGGVIVGHIQDGSVDVSTGGGGIDVGDVSGNLQATSGGGGVSVGRVGGDVEAHTGGGGITVRAVAGVLKADTGGGGIHVTEGGSRVDASSGGGGIEVEAAEGDVKVETGGGGIDIRRAAGAVIAQTGGGGIDIRSAGGAVDANTGGGGIDVDGAVGPVKVATGGGGIEVKGARASVEARTGGGSVSAELVTADPAADTHCSLESGGGDMAVYLPAAAQVTVDAEVRIQGRPARQYQITSDFPLEIRGSAERGSSITARGAVNGGGDLLRVRTTNGDIEIRKR